jgi:hypothetical protein
MRPLVALAIAFATVLVAGCSGAAPLRAPEVIPASVAGDGAIVVDAVDYRFELHQPSARATAVTFLVRNRSASEHDFVVVRFEDGRYGLPLVELEAIGAGESLAVRTELRPGSYRLVCLVVSDLPDGPQSHLALGMSVPFEVTG